MSDVPVLKMNWITFSSLLLSQLKNVPKNVWKNYSMSLFNFLSGWVQSYIKLWLYSHFPSLYHYGYCVKVFLNFRTPWGLDKMYSRGLEVVPRSIFTFLLFLIEENVSYQELFTKRKNIVPSQNYWLFKSQKYIQLHCAHEL